MAEIYVCNIVGKTVGSIFNWNEIGCSSGGNTNHLIFVGISTMF